MSVLNEIPALGPSSSYCVARRWMWTSCADTDTLNLEGGGGGGGEGRRGAESAILENVASKRHVCSKRCFL